MGENASGRRAIRPACAGMRRSRLATAAGDVRRLHGEMGGQAGPRIPRPQNELRRAARRRRCRSLRAHGPGRRPRHGRCPLSAEHAPTTRSLLRRPQGAAGASCTSRRSMPSASWPTSSRTPARASWSPPTSASWCLLAQKLKADGLVDHLIVGDDTAFGPSAIPTTPIAADAPRRSASTTLRAAGARQAAAAVAERGRRGHRAAAVHRRHHRQAQGRHAHATPT